MLKHSYDFEALGTSWKIETDITLAPGTKKKIDERIKLFDTTYSRFKKESLVTRISNQADEFTFPSDGRRLFEVYRHFYDISGHKVTPLIGRVLSQAGYDADYSFQPKPQMPVENWDDVMQWNYPVLTTKQPVLLDFGAAGKGHLVDIVASLLDAEGIVEYVIDASGDSKHRGTSENIVGLEHPLDPTKIIGAISVQNKSLCASAINRRVWGEGMHHVFDPDTIAPVDSVIAT